MMQSVDDDSSGKIEFEEFRKRFDNAQGAVKGDVLSSTVYLNANWMGDILKGVIRHDHAALHEFLQSEKMTELMHQARRLRVQGIISRALLEHNLLWPGMPPRRSGANLQATPLQTTRMRRACGTMVLGA